MKFKIILNQNQFRLVLISLMLMLLSACGGGTSGTGGQDSLLTGTVTSKSGQIIAGVNITHLESGESTQSDTAGHFELKAQFNEAAHLLVEQGQDLQQQLVLELGTQHSNTINISIVIDQVAGIVEIATVNINADTAQRQADLLDTEPISESRDKKPATSRLKENFTQSYIGQVVDVHNQPLPGVKVTLLPEDKNDSSDSQGKFRINTKGGGGNITLKVRYDGLSGSVRVSNIPKSQNVTVQVKLVLSIRESSPDPEHPEKPGRRTLNLRPNIRISKR